MPRPSERPIAGWPADRWPGAPPARIADERLVRALRQGDELAFAGLVRRHHGGMMSVALTYVGDRSVAEEVVQDTWLAVVREIARFEHRCALTTWIYRILVNRARTRGAREHRIVPCSSLGEVPGPGTLEPSAFRDGAWASSPRPWLDPERRLASLETRAALRTALQRLPDRQRAVVTLRDVEGLDAAEVAELLGISDGCQRVLLHRGRTRLRDVLDELLDDARLAA
jgi:RNA polymerase sigma-70 factor, ECF subfamily